MRRDGFGLRLCLAVIRVCAILVPASWRQDWRDEWDAEVRHRWGAPEGPQQDWRRSMDLFRRVLGALPDAAWLRRQFTVDAEAVHDVRHGLRVLRRSPSFTLTAVLILAIGIGGTVSIVTLLDTLYFRSLPYADASRTVTIWTQIAARPGEREDVSPGDFVDWRERARSFSSIAAAVPYSFDRTGGPQPEVLFGAQVTEGFWDALGMWPLIGRAFLPHEHVAGGPRSVIISHALWESQFGGDPQILNRAIEMDGEPWTIVGVLPREFAPQILPRPGELSVWTPKIIRDYEPQIRGSAWWNVIARLKPGVTVQHAQAEMDAISAALAREHPRVNTGRRAWIVPLREHLMGEVRVPLLVMLAAVLLVLAMGCVNVASLLLARGLEREREFAIRAALGAGRLRLVRQLVIENLLLAAIASAVGLAVAYWSIQAIVALAPPGVIRLHEAALDARALALAGVLTAVTAAGFGIIPARQLPRRARESLRLRSASGPRSVVRRGLVAAEIAFALVLLAAAGLLIRSFEKLMAVDPGFSAEHVVAVQVFAGDRNDTVGRVLGFFGSTIERMRGIPGVQAVGAVSAMPFAMSNIDIQSTLHVLDRPEKPANEQPSVYVTIATPGYFRALSIPLREGRLLEDRDGPGAPRVAVISEALRRREWPDRSPVGRRIRVNWQGEPLEVNIVGVVSQIRHERLDVAARPEIFLPLAQAPFTSMTYVLRGAGEPAALIDEARRAIWAVDPLQTVYDAAGVESLIGASLVRERFSMTLMSAFAFVALLLCASGIYGIVSVTTTQRTREIGVRMALGADGGTIKRMVLREGAALVSIGLVVGFAGALASARYVRSLLFETTPGDPATLAAVCSLLGVVALTACYIPARRATRVDPLTALRDE